MVKVGIPASMHYFRYFPAMKAFFEALDVEVVVTPATTLAILSAGVSCLVAETCLPIKAFVGHVASLKDRVDYVFVPSIKSVEKDLYNCVKIFALPDQVRGALPDGPPVLDMLVDINTGRKAVYKEFYSVGKRLGASRVRVERAIDLARQEYSRYISLLQQGLLPPEAMQVLDGRPISDFLRDDLPPDAPRVALIGHPYNLYDEYLNHNVVKKLASLGVKILTSDSVGTDDMLAGVGRIIGSAYWMNEKEITGAAGHYLYSDAADGVMIVAVFGCGPDSMMIDGVQRVAKRGNCNPLLALTIDEHTAETGLVTRIEAFVDTLRRRRTGLFTNSLPPEPVVTNKPRFGKDMKLAFPHMGTVHAALRVLFTRLGIQIVVPPPCSKRSLDLASKHSPEWACVPYKLTLGNFIEALEAGANSIALLTGPNNCRFGYYHKLQDQVLRDLGYEFQWVLPEISGRTISGVAQILQEASGRSSKECVSAIMLALGVQRNLDAIERKVQYVRARELQPGKASKIWRDAIEEIATVTDGNSLKAVRRKYDALLDAVPMDRDRDPVRICIVGEIYVVQEPYINHDIEAELGKLGVEVNRSEQVSQWLSLFPGVILDWIGIGHNARIQRCERPYLKYWSGETIGQTVMAYEDGYDGVIQLAPFTCTPEVVAQNVLPKLRRDVDIPVLTVILDEQTGRAGLVTRLEAFVELLKRRRANGQRRRRRPGLLSHVGVHLPPVPFPLLKY